VDRPRPSISPQSEEINEFSGILYYAEQKLEEARGDLLRALAKAIPAGSAQMYLGLVYYRMKDSNRPGKDCWTKVSGDIWKTWSLREEAGEKRALNYFSAPVPAWTPH